MIPIYQVNVVEVHAMRAFVVALLLCLPSLAAAETRQYPYATRQYLQHNPYTRQYEYAQPRAMPQYNAYTRQRELVGPGETLQYNAYTKRHEYAPPGAVPRYNPYTKQRQLVGPDPPY